MKELGIYIHIPFCLSKCRYCDFCSLPHPKPDLVEKYISAIKLDISEYGREYREYTVNTVYFGGGTPTLLEAEQLTELLLDLKKAFNLSDDAEISTECNPATADLKYFTALRRAGFNRLSLGVQSMIDGELKALGRLHTSLDSKKAITDARNAGFDNISVDVMFGIPEQTVESLSETITRLIELDPSHLSLYGLKIEDGTHFAKHRDKLVLPDEDTEYSMYLCAYELLSTAGYSRYEISNFAKDGAPSRHNLKYWLRQDYLGIGASAHSCVGNERFFETSDVAAYIARTKERQYEKISDHDLLCEKIMLSMRLGEGLDTEQLIKDHGDSAKKYLAAFKPYIDSRHAQTKNGRLFFTTEGMYVSNFILSEVLDFED